jgi:hypothetical protein
VPSRCIERAIPAHPPFDEATAPSASAGCTTDRSGAPAVPRLLRPIAPGARVAIARLRGAHERLGLPAAHDAPSLERSARLGHHRHLVEAKTIDPADVARLIVTDDVETAVEAIRTAAMTQFGLSYGRPARRWYLGE